MAAVNESRLVSGFIDLVAVDSPSYHEGDLAGKLGGLLAGMGLDVSFDGSAGRTGSDTGNLVAFLPGRDERAKPIFLCAHLDTVASSAGVRTVLEDGWIRTDGRTILGADDKAGIACALEAVRLAEENGLRHGGINLAFTVAEEVGLFGARDLDLGLMRATRGFVLDSGGPVGSVVVRTPAQKEFSVRVTGRAAHAGVEPEKGVNAIAVAAEALGELPWGRLDGETTANVGVVRGGEAPNIVPDEAVIIGEVRGRSERRLEELIGNIERSFVRRAQAAGASVRMELREGFPLLDVDEDSPLCRWSVRAARKAGVSHSFVARGGGSDANVLNKRGLSCVNLGMGMVDDHAKTERIRVRDLVDATRFILALVEESGEDD